MIFWKNTLFATLLLLFCHSANATSHRGVWFWNTTKIGGPTGPDSPHSSKFIVGPTTGAAEDEAIAFMVSQNIKEVYGSYLHRPRDVPTEIWPWNEKLDAAGIESQLLISGFEKFDPGPLTDPTHASLVTKVVDRLIDFNDAAPTAAAKFDALHLDLEPQSLHLWQTGTPATKRAYLDDLYDAYVDIRAALDAGGYPTLPIYADIPFSWDKLPVDGGSVDWADAADRDGWYASLNSVLDGLTIMTFSKDTFPELETATVYERTGPFTAGPVHVAIQPHVGPGKIWPVYPTFEMTMVDLELAYGEAHIENYAFWRHAWADFGPSVGGGPSYPFLDSLPELVSTGSGGGVIIFTGTPGYVYTIKHSSNPGGGWEEASKMRTRSEQARERLRAPVEFSDRRGFWIVTEEPEEHPTEEN